VLRRYLLGRFGLLELAVGLLELVVGCWAIG
jgi:hypothetical protein